MYHHRGSIWTKWDLHFHTPASYDYQDHSVTNQQIVETLIDNGVRLVAITDHHTMDVERIRELQQLGGNQLTVLPGIELRSELGGSESVHFIGIFPEDCDLDYVWDNLKTRLKLMPQDIRDKGGNDAVYVALKEAAELIHNALNGIVTIHAGKKSHSIENIRNSELFKMVQKKDLVSGSVDILEIGRPQDQQSYEEIVFPAIDKTIPLILGSDNHRITQYETRVPCWIKADACFNGLKKVLIEPRDRVYIGNQPPKLDIVKQQPAKFIKSVKIQKRSNSSLDEIWFDNVELKFNHNLIAIIGNKGTGKSALADVLALLGNTSNHAHFSFLNRSRFQTPKLNRSNHFEATLTWENGRALSTRLSKKIEATTIETIKYIPEGLFEEICNELAAGNASKFEKELEQVIFSHVPAADRLGKDSLDALIAYKTEQTDDAIATLKSELAAINAKIARLESNLKPEHRQQIGKQIAAKAEELEDHDAQKPAEVPKPGDQATPETEAISEKLEAVETQRADLKAKIEPAQKQEQDHKILVSVADRALGQTRNFQQQFKNFKKDLSEELGKLGLAFDDIVELSINRSAIEEKRTKSHRLVQSAEAQLDENRDDSLVSQLKTVQKNIQSLQDKLDKPNRLYKAYLAALHAWKQKRDAIVGSADQQDSLTYYKAKLAELDQLPLELQTAQQQRTEIVKQIYAKIRQLAETYRQLYQPVQRFIDEHSLIQETLQLNFAVSIVNLDLHSKFFDWIGRNVVGSFYGTNEGDKTLNDLVRRYDFNTEDGLLAFLDDLLDHLTHDKRSPSSSAIGIETQLRKNRDLRSFYNYLFSLDFLRPRYLLRMGDKEISQLSPGERGALLLIFYLLIDRDQTPVIIDQPEANLDNQTVYELLVNAIKEAKNHRQIIIVTHNPNLAVVCDAEQVICCDIDKQNGNKITYTSGAIENPEINKKIVDILEGTPPAFDNRRLKYE